MITYYNSKEDAPKQFIYAGSRHVEKKLYKNFDTRYSQLAVCTHTNVEPYNCGCTFGCETCGFYHECHDCGQLLREVKTPTLRVIPRKKNVATTNTEESK